jgi:hypothetical protein
MPSRPSCGISANSLTVESCPDRHQADRRLEARIPAFGLNRRRPSLGKFQRGQKRRAAARLERKPKTRAQHIHALNSAARRREPGRPPRTRIRRFELPKAGVTIDPKGVWWLKDPGPSEGGQPGPDAERRVKAIRPADSRPAVAAFFRRALVLVNITSIIRPSRNTQQNPPVHGLWMISRGLSERKMPAAVGAAPLVLERLRPSSSGLRTARPARPNPPPDATDAAPVHGRPDRSASEKTRRVDRR